MTSSTEGSGDTDTSGGGGSLGYTWEDSPVSLGVCLGASTISVVTVERDGADDTIHGGRRAKILSHHAYPHEGDPRGTLIKALSGIPSNNGLRLAATGRRFRHRVNLTTIPEPEAVGYAYRHLKPEGIDCPAIVSAGGETFMAYTLDISGQIDNVLTGNKCASGTGEFFLQQLRRMNVTLAEASRWSATAEPYRVSGRCSVFCKSDCTHATNKGVPRSRVAAGLCRMMAEKILELLHKVPLRHIMLTGGAAKNQMMVAYLKERIDGLVVPEAAPYFEALGAALWALDHPTRPYPGEDALFVERAGDNGPMPALADFESWVSFKKMDTGTVRNGAPCILGLDVGSTTTKAVLLRRRDKTMVASVYLRTDGDPVGASRKCYRSILEQVERTADPAYVPVIGLGVCGSGRQISGLHALTDNVINEIVAHCAAAVHFDPGVETLFEIGGQDAKYTHITAGVASDYAMNEACSAGTGSFLEEAAWETLGVAMTDIAGIALEGKQPPNFNDQCAAFISSDIKNAIHDGLCREDIVAGLVYGICMNYINRVKGNRAVGGKIFMQGGVCYNRTVPMAMAALVGRPIVVPPEPGLMGAFGVALEVDKRLQAGLTAPAVFDLRTLAEREVRYGKRFECKGGRSGCDRRCEIAVVHVDGRPFPFGGACNRYYNRRQRVRVDTDAMDLVRRRQHMVGTAADKVESLVKTGTPRPLVGINRSFLFHTYYPFYAAFFRRLGCETVVPDTPSPQGMAMRGAAFCYPSELTHGYFHTLISAPRKPDFLFLPHVKAIPDTGGEGISSLCPFVQGEPYFLRATFRKMIEAGGCGPKMLSPVIDFTAGLAAAKTPFIETARQMGFDRRRAAAAFDEAVAVQEACLAEIRVMGEAALGELAKTPDRRAVVVFGRPYNAFAEEAHMGIPRKLASRGVLVIPLDALPMLGREGKHRMYWGFGQRIMQAARIVAEHPQLFGVYVTNFSCGPDSFLIGYFRDIMGAKPSLTLELDSHTADAGLETRIEAFLDVVAAWCHLKSRPATSAPAASPSPARMTVHKCGAAVITSSGRCLPLTDPRVTMLFPSMGRLSSQALAASFAAEGINAVAAPPADAAAIKLGRAHTSGKECLPLIITTGALLNHLEHRRPGDVVVYFMVTGDGPCRFGQYAVFLEDLIRRHAIADVALLSLNSDDDYTGLSGRLHRNSWQAIVISDIMEDIRAMLLANATQPHAAMSCFENVWLRIIAAISDRRRDRVDTELREAARALGLIELRRPVSEVPVIALVGEIFVRRDGISRQYITERLAEMGFAAVCAPVAEWVHYVDWMIREEIQGNGGRSIAKRMGKALKRRIMAGTEAKIHQRLSRSGLSVTHPVDLAAIIRHAGPHLSPQHAGEAVLTVGSALREVISHACGVVAIGPFGCMPNRLAESVLNEVMTAKDKLAVSPRNRFLLDTLDGVGALPFLSIESDGAAFPQIVNAKLEAFCLRALRMHEKRMGAGGGRRTAEGKNQMTEGR